MLKHRKGFSLVELMIVVAIIGILIAVLLPELGDMANRSRISTAQRSMSAIRDAVIRYHAQEGRRLENLEWLVPKYLTELRRDPWGQPYTLMPIDGVVLCWGPDGQGNLTVPLDPSNRDNLALSYLPPLSISGAQHTVDLNGNGMLDDGDIFTVFLSKPPGSPVSSHSAGDDFWFMNDYSGTDGRMFTAGGNQVPHGDNTATDDTNVGLIAAQEPETGAGAGALVTATTSYDFIVFSVARDPGPTSSYTSDLFLRFNEDDCIDPSGSRLYKDTRGNIATSPNYNVKIKRPGEY